MCHDKMRVACLICVRCHWLCRYQSAHAKIRENPEYQKTPKLALYEPVNEQSKKTYAERKATIAAKKSAMRSALEAEDDE